jgi:DNA polymerase III subunit alpha
MSEKFTHLHCHSEYSLLEGALRISQMLEYCKEHNLSSIALTDNGAMYGAIDFYLKAKENGIKPILGCEMYLTEDITKKERGFDRLILLCKDYEGYQSLIHLVTVAFLEGFYYRPRIDLKHLANNSKGLIAISPGANGPVAYNISGNFEKSKEYAQSLKDIYGEDFYLGLQKTGGSFEDIIFEKTIEISKELAIPLVATNDAYYMTQDDAYLSEILLCIRTGRRLDDMNRPKLQGQERALKTPQEMQELFKDVPQAIENTMKISDKCNLEIETGRVNLPHFECPNSLAPKDYLETLVWKGIEKKYSKVTEEVKQRVEFELKIINKMNYPAYFLIIYDFLEYGRNRGIPIGPGRGSAAGSIVAYALDITNIDPLKYDLLFERFLNPDRISMPDIDLDFCIRRRGEIISYLVEKYGNDRVSQIVTFGSMAARGVVRDVGRVLDVPLNEVDHIAKLIPSAPGSNAKIAEAIETIPDLKKLYDGNKQIKKLLDIGIKLEGFSRHTSTHAAGIVISRDPLSSVCPLIKNDGQIITQFPMGDLEKIGLLKMDILGLRNLTVMEDAVNIIMRTTGTDIDLNNIPIDDEKTYDLLCSGHTIGIFQLESRGMRGLIKDLKPKVFDDIIALLALYRPGPLGSGMVNEFISNKSGKTKTKYELPCLEEILKNTYGIILYQEQVMQIASEVGGFSLSEADMLRRAMGKKQKRVMDKMRQKFLDGAAEKNINLSKAARMFDLCNKFAEYGFNKSHSAAYALISYQTAYLKTNYPVQYMTALLSSVINVADKASLYIEECKRMGITVLSPDINESEYFFNIINKKADDAESLLNEDSKPNHEFDIRFGLGAVKNVGEAAIENIIKARKEKGSFKDLNEFCLRVELRQVNKKVIESLILSGVFDSLLDRSLALAMYISVLECAQIASKERDNGQTGLFANVPDSINPLQPRMIDDYPILTHQEKLKQEKEILGLYISGHPLDGVKDKLESLAFNSDMITEELENQQVQIAGLLYDCKKIITRKGREMYIGNLEDLKGKITVLLFQGRGYEQNVEKFQDGNVVSVSGKVRINRDEKSIMCEQIEHICNIEDTKKVFIDVESIDDKEVLQAIKSASSQFRGSLPIYLVINDTQILISRKYWIKDDELCIKKLENIVGPGRIWVI